MKVVRYAPKKPRDFMRILWKHRSVIGPADPSAPLEEEAFGNDLSLYYPVWLGQRLNDRYDVVAKVGKGAFATVWCYRCYVTVKIGVATEASATSADRNSANNASRAIWNEEAVYQRIKEARDRTGQECLPILEEPLDCFRLRSGKNGKRHHLCLVLRPALMNLGFELRDGGNHNQFRYKCCVRDILKALDFLHTHALVVHADIKINNILLGAYDPERACESMVKALKVRNVVQAKWNAEHKRYTYCSSPSKMHLVEDGADPGAQALLSDFGHAKLLDSAHEKLRPHAVCINNYRAPESWLGLEWGVPVDIWAVGALAWEMLTDVAPIAHPHTLPQEHMTSWYLHELVDLLGDPPQEVLEKCPAETLKHWNASDILITPNAPFFASRGFGRQRRRLEDECNGLEGDEKRLFLAFMRRIFTWNPEARATAAELLQDPWLVNLPCVFEAESSCEEKDD